MFDKTDTIHSPQEKKQDTTNKENESRQTQVVIAPLFTAVIVPIRERNRGGGHPTAFFQPAPVSQRAGPPVGGGSATPGTPCPVPE